MGGDFAMTEVNELKYIYVTVLGKGIYVLDYSMFQIFGIQI